MIILAFELLGGGGTRWAGAPKHDILMSYSNLLHPNQAPTGLVERICLSLLSLVMQRTSAVINQTDVPN
jgi:hypothetical protein